MPGTSGSPCSVSRIDFGWPGRLMISAPLRITPTWRERIAVGTNFRLIWRICSPKPGITLSATARVASGVTSRGAGPVPPVVSTRSQRRSSTSSRSAAAMASCSSGMRRASQVIGLRTARPSHSFSAGMPLSSYVPADARSLTETTPMRRGSNVSLPMVLADELEELSIGAAAALLGRGRSVLAGGAHEAAQLLQVAARIRGGPALDRFVGGEQLAAPALGFVQGQGVLRAAELQGGHRLAQRLHVGAAHQLADVLHLAPPALVRARAFV